MIAKERKTAAVERTLGRTAAEQKQLDASETEWRLRVLQAQFVSGDAELVLVLRSAPCWQKIGVPFDCAHVSIKRVK
jgi:hypothetical protein